MCTYAVHSGVLDDMEYGCYTQWFDHIVKKDPPQIDLIGEVTSYHVAYTGFVGTVDLVVFKAL